VSGLGGNGRGVMDNSKTTVWRVSSRNDAESESLPFGRL